MPMQHWLLKTEPSSYSFADLARKKRETWDGITNALALKHLRTAQAGDLALIYHTGEERAAVGIARILGGAYPDPKRDDPKLAVIDLEPLKPLVRPVTLAEMRANPSLSGFDLLRLSRLSFVPVSSQHWEVILKMSGTHV